MVPAGLKPKGKSNLIRMPLMEMGKNYIYIRRQVALFRRQIEEAILAKGTPVGIAQASWIHTSCTALRCFFRLERVLAKAKEPGCEGGLDYATWMSLMDRLLKYKSTVDSNLARLGLDREDNDWLNLNTILGLTNGHQAEKDVQADCQPISGQEEPISDSRAIPTEDSNGVQECPQ